MAWSLTRTKFGRGTSRTGRRRLHTLETVRGAGALRGTVAIAIENRTTAKGTTDAGQMQRTAVESTTIDGGGIRPRVTMSSALAGLGFDARTVLVFGQG